MVPTAVSVIVMAPASRARDARVTARGERNRCEALRQSGRSSQVLKAELALTSRPCFGSW